MQGATSLIREALEKLARQSEPERARHVLLLLGFTDDFLGKGIQTSPDQQWPPAEIDDATRETFVHRHVSLSSEWIPRVKPGAISPEALFVTQGLCECLAQRDPAIFDGVVCIDSQVTPAAQIQVHHRVPCEERQHVVEKSNPGVHRRLARAIQAERDRDARLFCPATDLGKPSFHRGIKANLTDVAQPPPPSNRGSEFAVVERKRRGNGFTAGGGRRRCSVDEAKGFDSGWELLGYRPEMGRWTGLFDHLLGVQSPVAMNQSSFLDRFEDEHALLCAVLFGLLFVSVWVLTSLLSSRKGWRAFASRYAAGKRPAGAVWGSRVASFGGSRYTNCAKVIFCEAGLYFFISLLVRAYHSPFMVPWASVKRIERRTGLFPECLLDIEDAAGEIQVILPKKAEHELLKYKQTA